MASVSTWADDVRRPATAPLHYVNLPEDDCNYVRARDCANGRCVVEAINNQIAVLKSSAPDTERLAALKWLIHLVGDVHQPLHVGLAADKGGNLFQVRAFRRGSNLHAVWDSELIRRRAGGLSQLLQDTASPSPAASRPPAPEVWASDSCRLRRDPEFYPSSRKVDQHYAARLDAALVKQLSIAGQRLAETLNVALGVEK